MIQSFTYLKRAVIPVDPDMLTADARRLVGLMSNRLDGRALLIEPADDLAGRDIPVVSTITHEERVLQHGFSYYGGRLSKEEVRQTIADGRAAGITESDALAQMDAAYPANPSNDAWKAMQSLAHDIRRAIIIARRRADESLLAQARRETACYGELLDKAYRSYRVSVPRNRSGMTETDGALWLNQQAESFATWCRVGSFMPTTQ